MVALFKLRIIGVILLLFISLLVFKSAEFIQKAWLYRENPLTISVSRPRLSYIRDFCSRSPIFSKFMAVYADVWSPHQLHNRA